MNMKQSQIYLSMLIILALIATTYIAYTASQGTELCVLGSDCKSVQNSEYGSFFGVKVSVWGMIAFTLLFIIYGWAHNSYKRYRVYITIAFFGALISLIFITIQAFILKQWCSSCIIVDALMLIIAFLSYIEFKKLRKYYVKELDRKPRPSGRRLFLEHPKHERSPKPRLLSRGAHRAFDYGEFR